MVIRGRFLLVWFKDRLCGWIVSGRLGVGDRRSNSFHVCSTIRSADCCGTAGSTRGRWPGWHHDVVVRVVLFGRRRPRLFSHMISVWRRFLYEWLARTSFLVGQARWRRSVRVKHRIIVDTARRISSFGNLVLDRDTYSGIPRHFIRLGVARARTTGLRWGHGGGGTLHTWRAPSLSHGGGRYGPRGACGRRCADRCSDPAAARR